MPQVDHSLWQVQPPMVYPSFTSARLHDRGDHRTPPQHGEEQPQDLCDQRRPGQPVPVSSASSQLRQWLKWLQWLQSRHKISKNIEKLAIVWWSGKLESWLLFVLVLALRINNRQWFDRVGSPFKSTSPSHSPLESPQGSPTIGLITQQRTHT